jgi:hypothetical protein
MSGYSTLNGQYGSMPSEMLLRKAEVSCVPEAAGGSQLNDYFRQTLKGEGTIAPLFESDQKRTGRESKASLSLRYHGKRTPTNPWLPDGEFLDFEGTHPDPRSLMIGPDFHKVKEQGLARGKFIRFSDDNDYSIPEAGVAPLQMIKQIRGGQHEVARRLKIFDTSKSGFHNGSSLIRSTVHGTHSKTHLEHKTPEISDFTLHNRRNKTTSLSNDTSIGWRRTVDHEFKVSKYGRVAPGKVRDPAAWDRQRKNTRTGHQIFRTVEGRVIPHATAMAIVDIAKMKDTRHKSTVGATFAEARATKSHAQRRLAEDLVRAMHYAKETRDRHSDVAAEVTSRARRHLGEPEDRKSKLIINPTIVEKMASVNRKARTIDQEDLRNEIEVSAVDEGLYVTDRVRQGVRTGDVVEHKRNSNYDYEAGEEFTVAQYRHAPLPPGNARIEDMAFEDFGGEAHIQGQHTGRQKYHKTLEVGDTNVDVEFGAEHSGAHGKGPLGNKYTRSHQRTGHDHLSVNDL